jgi:hypothetical protein
VVTVAQSSARLHLTSARNSAIAVAALLLQYVFMAVMVVATAVQVLQMDRCNNTQIVHR